MHTDTRPTRALARILLALGIASLLGACASGVTRMEQPAAGMATATVAEVADVRSVQLTLSSDAKKLVADNLKFDPEKLRTTIERALAATGKLKAESGQTMEVEITGFRVRSNFSAIMWGFMAGNDNVEGVVTVKDRQGGPLKQAKVSAAYALGGLAGGQDEARMSWLYEEFAKLTVAEIGTPVAAK